MAMFLLEAAEENIAVILAANPRYDGIPMEGYQVEQTRVEVAQVSVVEVNSREDQITDRAEIQIEEGIEHRVLTLFRTCF